MEIMIILRILLVASISFVSCQNGTLNEAEMRNRLRLYNSEASDLCNKMKNAAWNSSTDIGNYDKETEKLLRTTEYARYEKAQWESTWRHALISDYTDENISRQLFFLKQLGKSALNQTELSQLVHVTTSMSNVYNSAKICPYDEQCSIEREGLTLDPNITHLMAHSRNFDELTYLWKMWHDNTGKKMRTNYAEYVNLMNKAAKENGLVDAAQMWQSKYEDAEFVNRMDQLWEQVEPLYDELHTFMKYKLAKIYGKHININDKLVPAHLFGNMWAQSWQNLYDDVKPFKNDTMIDLTAKLKSLDYTPQKMFTIANEFYMSMGLPSNEKSFKPPAIIEKPANRLIACHASAWDLCNGDDFRIKMCTNVNMEDFVTIHHEMGHIQYFLQYKDLPLVFRSGANPGFHEAIGDTIALSAFTPQHLLKIGILDEYKDTAEDNINALLYQALERIAFLPFGLLVDKWRWDVFSGRVDQSEWNKHWWDLREKYQKVSRPIRGSEADFDPGAKYHIPASSQYISYFISHILEFQLYKSLCIEANQYDPLDIEKKPLHKCDFYNSKEAGKKLADGLKLGSSQHWSEILKIMTSDTELKAEPIVEYFHPLREFLKKENARLKIALEAQHKLDEYNEGAKEKCNKVVSAEWDFITDINNKEKQTNRTRATVEMALFRQMAYRSLFKDIKIDQIDDESIKRQILYASKLGIYHLNESRLSEWSQLKSNMENAYSTATFCPYTKPVCDLKTEALTLEPEITNIMAKSTNFKELRYTWTQWFNEAGAPMRKYFKDYVKISNEAAALNGVSDYGELWRSAYEDPNFIQNMKNLWKKVEPLYSRLHEYTRFKLLEMYPGEMNEDDKLIPAHLLGNMWSQNWVNLFDRIKPFQNVADLDITKKLQELNFTALKMFQESDKFYQSLNLEPMEMSYTNLSIIEKPKNRTIVCHASAWDFCDGHDFRIKQCTEIDQKNFVTIHHEMGHIQYYILYKDQPVVFRAGANPGFHEAIGDLMALSVSTPKHLEKINVLENYTDTIEENLNALLKMALERVAFLPFGLLIDLYRWDIFNGTVPESNWNRHWEHLREKYQKIRSPVPRSEEHFDAGAKYHIPADYPYIAYFVSHILEFQLHRSMCLLAGDYDPEDPEKPLHKCDIGGSYKVGKRLRDGLSLGLSRHWSETLKILTGNETELSADALLEYFEPLDHFLLRENYRMKQLASSSRSIPIIIGAIIAGILVIILTSYCIYVLNRGRAVTPNDRRQTAKIA